MKSVDKVMHKGFVICMVVRGDIHAPINLPPALIGYENGSGFDVAGKQMLTDISASKTSCLFGKKNSQFWKRIFVAEFFYLREGISAVNFYSLNQKSNM